jgi:hypothetical protein
MGASTPHQNAPSWVQQPITYFRKARDDFMVHDVKWWSGRFLGIIGWDPSVCKSNRLHVDILWFIYIKLRYIPLKWSVILLKSWTSTGYFSNSTGSSVTNCRFSPITDVNNPIYHPICKCKPEADFLTERKKAETLHWPYFLCECVSTI